MPDTYLIQLPDPNDPTRTVSVPVRADPQALEALRASDPTLAAQLVTPQAGQMEALAREQDIARRQEVVRQNPIFGRLAAFSIGAVNELTLGGAMAFADDEERRTFEATQREFGGTMALGQAAGVLAPALITGGASLGEMGAANLVPGVLSQAAGNSTEQLLLRALAGRLSPGMARGLSVAGGMTVDGAISGAQAAITQANIEGTPLDAETILAGTGLGAGLGLLTGGVMGGAAGVSRSLRGAARAELGALAESGASPLLRDEVELLAEGGHAVNFRTPQQANGFWSSLTSNRAVRFLAGLVDSDEALVRELSVPGGVQDAGARIPYQEFVRSVGDTTSAALNQAERTAVDNLRSAAVRQAGFEALQGIELSPLRTGLRTLADNIRGVVTRSGDRLTTEAVERAGELHGLLVRAAKSPSVPELARRVDNLLDRARTTRMAEDWADPDLQGVIAAAIGDANGRSGSALEALLEGLGPEGQRAVQAHRAVRDFDNAIRDLKGQALRHNISMDELRLNPGQVFASVSDSGFRVKLDLTHDFARLNSAADKAVKVAVEGFGADAAQMSALQAQLRQSSSDLVRAKEWGRRIAIGRDLSSREAQGAGLFASLGVGGVGVGATLGAVLGGGIPGALIGGGAALAFAGATHPISLMLRLGSLSKAKAGVVSRMAEEVGGLRRALESGRRFRRAQQGARQVPKLVLNLRSKEERAKEYRRVTQHLTNLAANPAMLAEQLENAVGGAAELSPDLANYMSQTYIRGVQYLVANLPPADQPSPFGHLMDLSPSRSEMDAFLRRVEAIEDPLGIIRMAADFSLTTDHVEAVRSVYPELYTAIQAEITGMIGELTELPPYSARIQTATLLDVPADPSYDAVFIQRMQQRYAQTAQQQREIMGGGRMARQTTAGARRVATDTYSESTSLEVRLNRS